MAVPPATRAQAGLSARTAEFIRWRMPALPFLVVNQNFNAFLRCQRIMKPLMISALVPPPPPR
jgi:hypothetical protein